MIVINSNSPTDAWIKSHEYLLENGNKDVMNESINMSVEIEDNFDITGKKLSLGVINTTPFHGTKIELISSSGTILYQSLLIKLVHN